jgi:hypothetical protein
MGKKSTESSAEILDRIRRLSVAAEWTDEELDEALRQNGIDPTKLANATILAVRRLNDSLVSSDAESSVSSEESLPLLGVYRKRTNLKPAEIAKALGVTVTFISDLNRHARIVPETWRNALARLAQDILDIPRNVTLQSFTQPFLAPRAASRDNAYSEDTTSWEQLLDRSGMSEDMKRYWRGLLDEE